MIFTKCVIVKGNLHSSYVFQSDKDMEKWLENDFQKLQKKYGKLTYKKENLPGLNIGDTCRVWGEGSFLFVIKSVVKYSEHRYGFIMECGEMEEVAKCY